MCACVTRSHGKRTAATIAPLDQSASTIQHYSERKIVTNFEMVQEFNRVFNVVRYEKPTQPNDATIDLRMNLIWEEYNEVTDELEKESLIDLTKLTKELCDLLYVVYGMADTFGLPIDEAFAEVHRSNMSKLTKDGEVLRRADGKVQKSDQYSEADIKSIIERYSNAA